MIEKFESPWNKAENWHYLENHFKEAHQASHLDENLANFSKPQIFFYQNISKLLAQQLKRRLRRRIDTTFDFNFSFDCNLLPQENMKEPDFEAVRKSLYRDFFPWDFHRNDGLIRAYSHITFTPNNNPHDKQQWSISVYIHVQNMTIELIIQNQKRLMENQAIHQQIEDKPFAQSKIKNKFL